jgi:hypothetical protein
MSTAVPPTSPPDPPPSPSPPPAPGPAPDKDSRDLLTSLGLGALAGGGAVLLIGAVLAMAGR